MKIDDKAPDFRAIDNTGNEFALYETLKSGRKVILYFYPKNFTPGCTAEACSLRDGYTDLVEAGFMVVGVSPDSIESHKKFTEKHSLPFILIADEDHSIAAAYGAWGMKKSFGKEYMGLIRKTFVIDHDGRIERIFNKVETKDHFNQILNSYKK